MKLKDMTYGIIGMGIMGGSYAKAIRENILSAADATGKIIGVDRKIDVLKACTEDGVCDEGCLFEDSVKILPKCDMLIVCLYPHLTLEYLKKYRDQLKSGSIITDVSGIKGIFEKELPSILREDVDFIIGHPMAGGEKNGYAASNAKFFINRNYILIPQPFNKPENYELMKYFIGEIGFGKITETTCDIHDYKIGFTSQLCHVIASALVEAAPDEKITAFGGGSFEDLTRIAMINANLWTELFVSNKEKLVSHIDGFMKQMEKFRELINNSNESELHDLLEDVRNKRVLMSVKN